MVPIFEHAQSSRFRLSVNHMRISPFIDDFHLLELARVRVLDAGKKKSGFWVRDQTTRGREIIFVNVEWMGRKGGNECVSALKSENTPSTGHQYDVSIRSSINLCGTF